MVEADEEGTITMEMSAKDLIGPSRREIIMYFIIAVLFIAATIVVILIMRGYHPTGIPASCDINGTCLEDNSSTFVQNETYESVGYYSSYAYPNPNYTTGDIMEGNATRVCVSGYTSTVRNVPNSLRNQIYAEYNYDRASNISIELDHFIPLCLGGSNDAKNLWVQYENPKPGFKEKDRVEDYLCHQVCNGNMTLSEAQMEIWSDWVAVYLRITERYEEEITWSNLTNGTG